MLSHARYFFTEDRRFGRQENMVRCTALPYTSTSVDETLFEVNRRNCELPAHITEMPFELNLAIKPYIYAIILFVVYSRIFPFSQN